jgi:ribosomal protein S18 acetylase RimI-like enzyme
MEKIDELSALKLAHFSSEDESAFIEMVADPDIQKYFQELDNDIEIIRYKFRGINEDIVAAQYWGIYNKDGVMVGFCALKKSLNVYHTLKTISQDKTDEINDDLIFETPEEEKKRKWREKFRSPYVVDIAVHKNFRGRKIGKLCLTKVLDYVALAAIKEVYFEVHEDNKPSINLIEGLEPELIADASVHNGHRLYRLSTKLVMPNAEALRSECLSLIATKDKNLCNHWRKTVIFVPELNPHRQIITELYGAIITEGARLDPNENMKYCRHTNDYIDKAVIVGLQQREDPLTLIWSIAHEYGHILQNEAKEKERQDYTREKYLREADAWDKAEKWLFDKPFYIYNWSSFIRFRNKRLESYLPDCIRNDEKLE